MYIYHTCIILRTNDQEKLHSCIEFEKNSKAIAHGLRPENKNLHPRDTCDRQ